MAEEQIKEIVQLYKKLQSAKLPPDLAQKANLMVQRAESALKFSGQSASLDQVEHYIEWITSLPWFNKTQDTLDLIQARQFLDKNHYGLGRLKDRILEYLAVMKLKEGKRQEGAKFMRAPILCFVGLVGTGKTTIAYSIAQAMGRKFERVPFGGMGSALDLRGQSRQHAEAEPGAIIKALRRAGSKNPVLLLDEIDRVSERARTDIMGVLVELLDPEQNIAYLDHYIDFPFDLGEVLFIATANNTKNISTAVLDRLEPIQMPSYTDEEKKIIGRDYVLPKVLQESGLQPNQLIIDEDVWPTIVRPLGFDAGIRTLERTIKRISRKAAKLLVEGKTNSVHITLENVKQFVPRW
jgi:ATP-dependent Lon protease